MADDNTANDVYSNPDTTGATGGDSTPPTTPVEPPQTQPTDPTPPTNDPAGNPADDGGDLEVPQQPGAADSNASLGSTPPPADEHQENGGAEV